MIPEMVEVLPIMSNIPTALALSVDAAGDNDPYLGLQGTDPMNISWPEPNAEALLTLIVRN